MFCPQTRAFFMFMTPFLNFLFFWNALSLAENCPHCGQKWLCRGRHDPGCFSCCYCVAASQLHLQPLGLLLFLPDLCADAIVHTLREPVAQLVDDAFQVLFQRLIFQLPVDGSVPALVQPEGDLPLAAYELASTGSGLVAAGLAGALTFGLGGAAFLLRLSI